jgi:sarcosine oxidase
MHDVIVVGLGGMGGAAALHLAGRGAKVLGLEQFDIPHARGSSHGVTRIIRLAYWEHPSYVPLLQRAYALWRDLEQRTGERLLVVNGSIDAGGENSRPIAGALQACADFGLPHDRLDAAQLAARFPGYRLPNDIVAVFQPDGGFLLAERCLLAQLAVARAAGADLRFQQSATGWTVAEGGVTVRTTRETYRARRLVVTAGAWAGTLLSGYRKMLSAERQVMFWTSPRNPELVTVERFPVFYIHVNEGAFYGFPIWERGFKIGKYHHRGQAADPDVPVPQPDQEDERILRAALIRYFPAADGPAVAAETCLFTNTPDEHFLIGPVPGQPEVIMAAGFSGHGFKFCSVVGEILADLALDGATRHDISLFDPARFG